MNMKAITVQDCIDMYRMKGMSVLLENGQVVRFTEEQRKWRKQDVRIHM